MRQKQTKTRINKEFSKGHLWALGFFIMCAIFVINPTKAFAANRYWVGGTNTWDATAGSKWATSSGAAGGAAVPTSADDCFFDAASGAVTVTTSGTITDNCKSMDFTGFTGTFNHAATTIVNIGGSSTGIFKTVGGMTYTVGSASTSVLNFVSTTGTNNITTGGDTMPSMTFNGAGGTWQLQDNLTATGGTITLLAGTLDLNTVTINASKLFSSGSVPRTLTMGSSSINLNSNLLFWSVTGINFTTNAGTSLITGSGIGARFTGGAHTYYDLTITGTASTIFDTGNTFHNVTFSAAGVAQILGSETFNNLTRTGTAVKTDSLTILSGATLTVNGTLTLTGNSTTNRLYTSAQTAGSISTINAAAVSLTNVDFDDITAAGAAAPFTGTSIGNCIGNTQITGTGAVTRYWVATTGGSWSATSSWASGTGGASGQSVPLCHDTVIFDGNSITSGSRTITQDMARIPALDLTNLTNSPTFSSSVAVRVYGSMTLISGLTFSGTGTITFAGRGSYGLTTAGKTITGSIAVSAPGGTFTLQDNLTMSSNLSITVSTGTFDFNGKTVSAGSFSATSALSRTITMGAANITLAQTSAGWNAQSTGTGVLTLNAGTSSITTTGSNAPFNGGGATYYDVAITGSGTSIVSGNNSFHNFTRTGTAVKTDGISLPASGTQTISNLLTLSGNSLTNRLFVFSSVPGTSSTLNAASVSITNVDFEDTIASGAASPFTGTSITNGGGNSNITATAPVTRYWVGNAGSWSDTTHWSTLSGGATGASVPLVGDTAVFDASSITSGSQTITEDMPRIPGLDFTNVANNPTYNNSVNTRIYGSVIYKSGMAVAGAGTMTMAGRGSFNIDGAGIAINSLIISNPTGTVTLINDLNTVNITFTAGTFTAGIYNVTSTTSGQAGFSTTGAAAMTINMGSGTWTTASSVIPWSNSGSNVTINAGASTIKITDTTADKPLSFGNFNYYNLWIAQGSSTHSVTIQGSSSFNDIKDDGTGTHTVFFTAGTTQTVNTFTVNGTSGHLISLRSTIPTTNIPGTWGLQKNNGSVSIDYVSVENSVIAGTGLFYANTNSTNEGGNAGWNFGASPTFAQNDTYRWYSNADSVTPGSALAAENSRPVINSLTTPIRLRMGITSPAGISATSSSFKLQYGLTMVGPWTDLPSAWTFKNNASPTDGATVSSLLLTGSNVAESYQESNPTPSNPNAISAGQVGEYDFAIIPTTALFSTNYYFRAVQSDGTPFGSYTNNPTITIGNFGTNGSTNGNTGGGTVAWWNSSWASRRKITLDNSASSSTLTNFPVLVALSSSNITFAKTKAGGADLRFVASDNSTQLSYEIEKWDTSGTSYVWVKIPSLVNNNTQFIYVYYNNPNATDAQSATSVWDTNYQGVYHLPNGTTLNANDSTSSPANGTINSATAVSAKVDGGANFIAASTQNINLANPAKLQITGNLTLSAWVYLSTLPGSDTGYTILSKDKDTGGRAYNIDAYKDSSNLYGLGAGHTSFRFFINGGDVTQANGHNIIVGNTNLSTSTWYHVEGVYNTSGTIDLYVNGVSDQTQRTGESNSIPTATANVRLGQMEYTGFESYFNGNIDEARISNSSRPADWVKAEYNWESSPNTYDTFAAEENLNLSGGGSTNGGSGGGTIGWQKGFNFRATSGGSAQADGANETYSLGESYPTTRNGVTFGWLDAPGTRDRIFDGGVDRRLAGINFGNDNRFQVDLPSAGTYAIQLAIGDYTASQTQVKVTIKDNTTTLLTVGPHDVNPSEFYDASNTLRSSVSWVSSEASTNLTFSTSTLILKLEASTSNTVIAHLFITKIDTPAQGGGGNASP